MPWCRSRAWRSLLQRREAHGYRGQSAELRRAPHSPGLVGTQAPQNSGLAYPRCEGPAWDPCPLQFGWVVPSLLRSACRGGQLLSGRRGSLLGSRLVRRSTRRGRADAAAIAEATRIARAGERRAAADGLRSTAGRLGCATGGLRRTAGLHLAACLLNGLNGLRRGRTFGLHTAIRHNLAAPIVVKPAAAISLAGFYVGRRRQQEQACQSQHPRRAHRILRSLKVSNLPRREDGAPQPHPSPSPSPRNRPAIPGSSCQPLRVARSAPNRLRYLPNRRAPHQRPGQEFLPRTLPGAVCVTSRVWGAVLAGCADAPPGAGLFFRMRSTQQRHFFATTWPVLPHAGKR